MYISPTLIKYGCCGILHIRFLIINTTVIIIIKTDKQQI